MMSPTLATLDQLATILQGRATTTFIESLSDNDWLRLIGLANRDRHRLTPALQEALFISTGTALRQDVQDYLALVAKANDERNAAIRSEILDVVGVLNAVSLEPVLLKGAAALMHPEPALALRMVGDIDLLVPETGETRALAALKRAGFIELASSSVPHTIADLSRPGSHAQIDLHRAVLDAPFQDLLSAKHLFEGARRIARQGVSFRIPSPEGFILHALLHAQIHNLGYYWRHLHLGAARDVAVLSESADWDMLRWWTAEHRMQSVVGATLLAAHRFFGLPWPLAEPPSPTVEHHHQRTCEVEIAGGWDYDLTRFQRLRELFAADRISARFGSRGSYLGNVARLGKRGIERYGTRKLIGRVVRG
jgi:hypothetical protein